MKILIAYASAGTGHRKAAEALYGYLSAHSPDIDVKAIDILHTTSAFFRSSYSSGYSVLVTHVPFAWKCIFWATKARFLRRIARASVTLINLMSTGKFQALLIREDPDWVVATHFLPAEIAARLKQKGKIRSKVATVITDFGVHPFWVSDGVDLYMAASETTRDQLLGESVDAGRIRITGIPIEEKFLKGFDKRALCQKFGLKEDEFTVLISTGSFGIGPIPELVASLHKEAQVIVVCANNKKLYALLESKQYPHCRFFGFVDNIQELMAVSKVIVAKPGGLTITESLAMDLVPIFITAIPGQETENISVLAKYGIGKKSDTIEEVGMAILELKNHPDQLDRMRTNLVSLKKPFAAKEIIDALR